MLDGVGAVVLARLRNAGRDDGVGPAERQSLAPYDRVGKFGNGDEIGFGALAQLGYIKFCSAQCLPEQRN